MNFRYSHLIELDTVGAFDNLVIKSFKKISVLSYGLFVDSTAFLELRNQFMKHITQAMSAHLMNLFHVTDLVVQSKMIRNTGVLKKFTPLFNVFTNIANGSFKYKQHKRKQNHFTLWRMNATEYINEKTEQSLKSAHTDWLIVSKVCTK